MTLRPRCRWLTLLGMAWLAGCAAPPPAPAPSVPMPAAWTAAAAVDAPAPGLDWWARFESAELTRLLDAALRHNRELQAALGRLTQARGRAALAGSTWTPQVDAAGGLVRDKAAGGHAATRASAGFSASYEIDLFGRNRQAAGAASGREQAGVYALEAVRVSVQAEVAIQYFQVLSLRDRLALGRRSLGNAESTLALLQTQARAGTVSGLEVLRQRALVASVQAGLPPLERALQQSQSALAVLTGQPPQSFVVADSRLVALQLPAVAPGLPAQLLRQRPDVRQAEAELAAAHADVAAAHAALFPSLRLTADAGSQTTTLSTLLRSGSIGYAAGASLAAVLFDGGRRRGEVQLSEGRRDELAALYEQAILWALRDVEDGLAAVARGAEQATHQQQVIEHARAALRLADLRYRNGAVDFSTVLDAQRVLLAAEDAAESIALARFVAAVGLFRALGGGWDGQALAWVATVSR